MEKMDGKVYPLAGIMSPNHPVDTQILAKSIASTDSLVRRLRQEQEEGAKLKSMIDTMRKTSMKIHKMYVKEKEKSERNEKVNTGLRDEIERLKKRLEVQNNEMINLDCVHQQSLAEIQESAKEVTKNQKKIFSQLVREYLGSVGKLEQNDLLPKNGVMDVRMMKGRLGKFPWLREVLREFQSPEKKVKRGIKKRMDREASTESSSDTDGGEVGSVIEPFLDPAGSFDSAIELEVSEPIPQKIFCDKGTMTTSITVTRGTNTENARKTADAATLFPEFNPPSSYEEIFREMIVDVPEIIETIPNTILRDVGTECDVLGKEMVNAETLTDLCNIRKSIGYRKRKSLGHSPSVKLEHLKIEPPSPKSDDLPLLHPQFDRLWSLMGQTLFTLLRNSCDIGQNQFFLERENVVKAIFMEEMQKRESSLNDFMQYSLPVLTQESSEQLPQLPETPPELDDREHFELEKPAKVARKTVPVKRKRSNVIVKSLKKIKLQRQKRAEENVQEDLDSLEDFDLEKIREFYALPELLEGIPDLPEGFGVQNCDRLKSQEAEELIIPSDTVSEPLHAIPEVPENISVPNCTAERLEALPEPPAPSTKATIMNFVRRQKLTKQKPNPAILNKCRVIVREYLQVEWVATELERFVQRIAVLKVEENVIFEVVSEIAEGTSDELMFNPFGSMAPLIPRTHQQIIIFCHRLSPEYPTGFLRRFRHALERRMFTLKAETKSLKNLTNLTYLLIALMDLEFGERHGKLPVRLFIFKCLYYFHHKAPPLILMTLKAFPDAIPEGPEENFETMDTLLLALRCSLANLPPLSNAETENPEYKKKELFQLLLYKYKYHPGNPSPTETTNILMTRLNQGNCHSISHAFTLLAKRMGVSWAKPLVHKQLIPRLNDLLLETAQEMRNHQIVSLITTISCIVKAFPNKEDTGEYHRIFGCILESSAGQHHVQEAAVAAFLRLSRFGMVNVFSQIYQWKAKMPISRDLQAALNTFVHRKPKKFWITLERQIK